MNAREFMVSVTSARNNDARDHGRVILRIEDGPSGEVMADIEFTPGEWWSLLTGLVTRAAGMTTNHPERLGCRMENEGFIVPRDATPSHDRTEGREQALAWAADQLIPADWDTIEAQLTNAGWRIVGRRWRV